MAGGSKAFLFQSRPSPAWLRNFIRNSVVAVQNVRGGSRQSRSFSPRRAACWQQERGKIQGVAAASSAAEAAAATDAWVTLQPTAAKGQLYAATLGDGHTLWLEVLSAKGPRVQLLCYGETIDVNLSLTPAEVRHKGFLPRLSEPWLRRCPGLAESLTKMRKHQQEQQQQGPWDAGSLLPSQLLSQHGVSQLRLVTSINEFAAEVQQHPAWWCDGTGPEDPPLIAEQVALLSAGELLAFLQGSRGVCILQLYKGWGEKGADQQPLLRPFVLQLLQRAAEDKGVLLMGSAAPEGLGASLLLCARQQPFKAWAEHLATVGVQAALVADSPFYKLLVGRILGYKEGNIHHHIEATGGSLDGKVIAAVDEQLKSLSSAAAVLPWKRRR